MPDHLGELFVDELTRLIIKVLRLQAIAIV